jgi:hypothetical protein
MKKYKVIIASTIYYQAIVESKSAMDIDNDFMNGELDFTTWREIDLDSSVESITLVEGE